MFRVAIVGCGLIGNKRAQVVRDDPSCVLVGAADVKFSAAKQLTEAYGNGEAKSYRDWNRLLERENPDLLIVATPNKYLLPVALEASRKRIHLLCEKPLGRGVKESARIVESASKHDIVLKTGFNHRYHPAVFRAHQLLEEGCIGKILFARSIYGHGGRPGYEKEWRANKDISGGGELLDQGVHIVDLFRWFLGDFDEAFGYAPTCCWKMEVEDNAFAFFRTKNGKIASMHTSWTQWKNRFTMEIYGEAGYLIVDGLGGSYGTETLKIGRRKLTRSKMRQYAGGAPEEETIVFEGPDRSWSEEWKDFTDAVKERKEPLGSGRDGLEANRMIAAVYASARKNRPVKIKNG